MGVRGHPGFGKCLHSRAKVHSWQPIAGGAAWATFDSDEQPRSVDLSPGGLSRAPPRGEFITVRQYNGRGIAPFCLNNTRTAPC